MPRMKLFENANIAAPTWVCSTDSVFSISWADGTFGENSKNDSVDGKHLMRFLGKKTVFKFTRISVDRLQLTL